MLLWHHGFDLGNQTPCIVIRKNIENLKRKKKNKQKQGRTIKIKPKEKENKK